MDEQALRRQISAAFPALPFRGRVTDCTCEECGSLSENLRDKSWTEVPDDFVDLTCSPILLTASAFHAFLPAYMLRSLDSLAEEQNVVEFTVYSLSPRLPEDDGPNPQNQRLTERAKLMTAEQILAIRNFLSHVLSCAPDSEWLNDFIGAALSSVWRRPDGPDV